MCPKCCIIINWEPYFNLCVHNSSNFCFKIIFGECFSQFWKLCWHACRRRDKIILTCRLEKNIPTMALQTICVFLTRVFYTHKKPISYATLALMHGAAGECAAYPQDGSIWRCTHTVYSEILSLLSCSYIYVFIQTHSKATVLLFCPLISWYCPLNMHIKAYSKGLQE